MANIYRFQENNLAVEGEKQDMLKLAELLRNEEGTLGDLRWQIEYAFDIDGIRSGNAGEADAHDPNYAEHNCLKTFDWFYEIMEALVDQPAGEIWATDEEILCSTEAVADAIVEVIQELYSKNNEEVVLTTGYYDPAEDIAFGTCDRLTGWWYVRID